MSSLTNLIQKSDQKHQDSPATEVKKVRKPKKSGRRTTFKPTEYRNLFSSVNDSMSQSQMSSTSTSKFGMEKKSNAKDSSRRSEDFTSFTSSLNTDLDSLPLKAGVGKSDPLFIANKVNNILISGRTKYRVPTN